MRRPDPGAQELSGPCPRSAHRSWRPGWTPRQVCALNPLRSKVAAPDFVSTDDFG